MRERLQDQLRNLLKIPGEPAAPFGAPGSVRVFRAGPGFLRYRLLGWSVRQLGALLGILFVLQFFAFDSSGVASRIEEQMNQNVPLQEWDIPLTFGTLWKAFEMLAIAGFVVQLPFTFLMLYLDYDYRWYILTDRSLRIREGLMRIDERTMTFSNIQNVTVRQGPLQRLLGISDLEVSTAIREWAERCRRCPPAGTCTRRIFEASLTRPRFATPFWCICAACAGRAWAIPRKRRTCVRRRRPSPQGPTFCKRRCACWKRRELCGKR
jgi:hypothetical protein